MKSLWVVNKCCGALHKKLYGKKSTGGQWLDAMLEESLAFGDEIVVVNIEKKPRLFSYNEGNVHFYTIAGEPNEYYNYKSSASIATWRAIYDKERPDVMVIWGTEFPYGLAAMKAMPEIPAIIYVQGILDSIGKYYLSGMNENELRQARSLRDILTGTTIKQTKRRYEKRAKYEREIVKLAGNLIVENIWAESYYRKVSPNAKFYYIPISISSSFREHIWCEEGMMPHTIMCSAANYPIKGLHMLLKALAIVKNKYPDVKLYIPGTVLKSDGALKTRLKRSGYDKFIIGEIKRLGLQDNILYTGRLTADEMADKMSEVNCFVMSSAIENHSSTLKEAMTVGTPSVASYVGGVPEYATDGVNCLLYRYEDYEVLAYKICRLFDDRELRQRLSSTAREDMQKNKEKLDYELMLEAQKALIKNRG